jgi:hypothetical protein
MLIESQDITLSPGIVYDGKQIKTARVKLLTRGERKAIDLLPDDKQDDRSFKDSISKLGHLTEREKIDEAAELLFAPDEVRINQAIKALHEKYMEPSKSEPQPARSAP